MQLLRSECSVGLNGEWREPWAPEYGSYSGWPLVLYFHHVRDDIEHYTVLRSADFSYALDLLGRLFRPLDPQSVMGVLTAAPAEPTCLITFDDGYRDVLDSAVPAMEDRGWRAIMFVSSGLVGAVEAHPQRGALEHMTWSDLRDLQDSGHVIASHGHRHRDLSLLSPLAARAEIAGARERLAEELGQSPALLAYPYGNQPTDGEALDGSARLLCFGSVTAAPVPWVDCPRLVRRTFLPTDAKERWLAFIRGWRWQWEGLSLP